MKKFYFVLTFAFILLFKPAISQRVECFILKAPEKPFYDVKKIGVLNFECKTNSRMNNVITDYMIADLLNEHRGIYSKTSLFSTKPKEGKTFIKGVKTDFYEVIERQQLEKILKEQRLSLSGAIDETSAAEVGKILGLDVIIIGNTSYTHNDEWRTTESSRCLKRTVITKGTMKIIDVKTARIVGTKSSEATFKQSGCGDQISGMKSVEQLADAGMQSLAKTFVDYFTPGYQHMVYSMEKVKLNEFKDKGKEAMNFLKRGDLDHAFPIVYAMYEADSYNPKTDYNLGVLYEMVGDYENAYEYFNQAYELEYDNKKYQEATERAKKGIDLINFLESIGRPVEPYSFSSGGAAGALADKVTIKGGRSDRINVYELPDKSSKVIAKVPGGLEFKIVEELPKFYEIQLRGTQTGFLYKKDAK